MGFRYLVMIVLCSFALKFATLRNEHNIGLIFSNDCSWRNHEEIMATDKYLKGLQIKIG